MKTNFLLQKIKEEFPEIKWKHYKLLTHGWDHIVIIFDNKLVFRAPKDKKTIAILKKEGAFLKLLLNKVNLQIPDYQFIAKDNGFVGYRMIKGFNFMPWRYKKANIKSKKVIIQQIASFINTLHAIPLSEAKKYGIKDEFWRTNKWNMNLLSKIKKHYWSRLSNQEKNIIKKHFSRFKDMNRQGKIKVVVHGDLWMENILIKKDNSRLVGIIDFSDRSLSDPAWEFVGFWKYGKKFVKEIYKKYNKKNKDSNFLNRSRYFYQHEAMHLFINAANKRMTNFTQARQQLKERFTNYES